MEERRENNVRYQQIKKVGHQSNETVRTFSKQVMAKAEKNFGKIQSLIKSTSNNE